jgi:hypothetical protein
MFKYITIDSVSELSPEHKNLWIFCGSHGGTNAAKYALSFSIAGIVFNDAGIGKDDAGVAGLDLCDEYGIPAAAVDCNTSRIGEGKETFENGILSRVNKHALQLGISERMCCSKIIDFLNSKQQR